MEDSSYIIFFLELFGYCDFDWNFKCFDTIRKLHVLIIVGIVNVVEVLSRNIFLALDDDTSLFVFGKKYPV